METPRQPLQQGAVYTGTVEGYSSDGCGIVRLDGAVVFVPRAVRGETRSFLDKVYRGSVGLMVSALAEDKALSRAEIDELYEILRKAEEGQR